MFDVTFHIWLSYTYSHTQNELELKFLYDCSQYRKYYIAILHLYREIYFFVFCEYKEYIIY